MDFLLILLHLTELVGGFNSETRVVHGKEIAMLT
jgi:hypothetical protein